jgi:hypothetical protein
VPLRVSLSAFADHPFATAFTAAFVDHCFMRSTSPGFVNVKLLHGRASPALDFFGRSRERPMEICTTEVLRKKTGKRTVGPSGQKLIAPASTLHPPEFLPASPSALCAGLPSWVLPEAHAVVPQDLQFISKPQGTCTAAKRAQRVKVPWLFATEFKI